MSCVHPLVFPRNSRVLIEAHQRFSEAANPAALRITATVRSMPTSELIIKL
jgi:hypothetical protein